MLQQNHPVQPGHAAISLPTASAAPHPRPSGRGAFPRPGVKRPVEWQGKVYPSITALAAALGLSKQTVSHAVRTNRMHTLGQGRMVGLLAMQAAHRQPCAAHGWHWPSQRDAARALGVTERVVSARLNRGTFADLVMQRLGVKG